MTEELDQPVCEFCNLTFFAFVEVRFIDTDESFYCCAKPECIARIAVAITDVATEDDL